MLQTGMQTDYLAAFLEIIDIWYKGGSAALLRHATRFISNTQEFALLVLWSTTNP